MKNKLVVGDNKKIYIQIIKDEIHKWKTKVRG